MRIYMQMPPADGRPPRYYQLILQEDLLGGWTVVKESGRPDSGARIRREHYPTREDAERALMKTRDAQLGQGYRVVFVEGERTGFEGNGADGPRGR